MIPIHGPVPTGSNYTSIIPVCPMEHGPIFKDLFTRNKTSYMRQYYKDLTSYNTSLIYFAKVLKLNHYYIKFKKNMKKTLYLSHSSFQFFPDCRRASYLLNKQKHSVQQSAIPYIIYITMQSSKSIKVETCSDLKIYSYII